MNVACGTCGYIGTLLTAGIRGGQVIFMTGHCIWTAPDIRNVILNIRKMRNM